MERPRQRVERGDDDRMLDRDFVVDVLHELRSPLTVVGGRARQLRQQLRAGETDPAVISARLDEIANAANAMAAALETLAARAAAAEDAAA